MGSTYLGGLVLPSHYGTLLAEDRRRSRSDIPAMSKTAIDRRFRAGGISYPLAYGRVQIL